MKVMLGAVAALALLVPQGPEVGAPAPAVELKSLDGQVCNLAELSKEKVVVIVSWSVDCPSGKPCIPRATEVAKKFADNPKVVFVAVNSYGDAPDKLAAYAKENGIAYPIVHDADKKIGKALGAKKVNSAYVFAGGKLFWRGGITKDGKDPLVEAIEAALSGKAAPEGNRNFAG
ncbi:MAG: redoxin domain-containing protein [Planctomycetota bacterium]